VSASPRTRIVVLDAPSNLGLRPPREGSVPGCYKLGWALREAGLLADLDVKEAGVVVPPRYVADWGPGDGDRNAQAIAHYSIELADRLSTFISEDVFSVVLGGDCSILLGPMLALRRQGRHGLVFLDGHSDFRHPDNAEAIGAAAGEDLAIVTGRGDTRLTDLEGLGPSVRDDDVAAAGVRATDEHLEEMKSLDIEVLTVDDIRAVGIDETVNRLLDRVTTDEVDRFWIHLDVDILDTDVMPAVDTPTPGGLTVNQLTELLVLIVGHPKAAGIDIGIFDPDLDPDGDYARALAPMLNQALRAASHR
jgi:arginase